MLDFFERRPECLLHIATFNYHSVKHSPSAGVVGNLVATASNLVNLSFHQHSAPEVAAIAQAVSTRTVTLRLRRLYIDTLCLRILAPANDYDSTDNGLTLDATRHFVTLAANTIRVIELQAAAEQEAVPATALAAFHLPPLPHLHKINLTGWRAQPQVIDRVLAAAGGERLAWDLSLPDEELRRLRHLSKVTELRDVGDPIDTAILALFTRLRSLQSLYLADQFDLRTLPTSLRVLHVEFGTARQAILLEQQLRDRSILPALLSIHVGWEEPWSDQEDETEEAPVLERFIRSEAELSAAIRETCQARGCSVVIASD